MRGGVPGQLSRRAVAASLLAVFASKPPLPLIAASAPASCQTSSLLEAQKTLEQVEQLLPNRASWPDAAKLLGNLEINALGKSLEVCVDPKSLKDQAMNNAAFIVYYEEARYKDTRLEPQTPSLRAEQNGRKKELLRALEDAQLELNYLQSHPEENDSSDLRAFTKQARGALQEFLALLPKPTS